MARVILKNIVKRFKSVTAVDDLSIEIQDKEFAVLVGPSGCGKTTALRMIAGLESVTSGEITIGDRLVNDVPPKDRDIAMVFQNYALYPHMNVRDNLGFGLKMRKFPKPEIDQRVQEAADILGIHELLDRKPKQLSGGQRQRVAVGRAIVRKPDVFLFDEPLSNLDAKLRVAMRAEISKLHRRLGATIIYVTHDQVEAMTMASRIFIMQNGALQQSGVPLHVYKQPANRFVAGFIGSPAMNFMPATLVEEQGAYYVHSNHFKVRLPDAFYPGVKAYAGRPVIFGVRPEDMAEQQRELSETRANTIPTRVEVVETLGAETFVHLTCGSHPMVARVTVPDRPLIVGQELEIALNMSNVHLFDKDTSRTIV
ncbi:sn-glycerol-3-phosphate ABC transporter ATP-binding protein UgpC [uncultured Desulfosarcina sp.]|uniref:ABC transporter ATP-binding protein n=1 Tax=uncultured Desulfosarcina sp. TaxID=218289 RepID=UPI0029C8EFB9|nr:sn-glycerol-3-phosphate ABC transporter ATP-binding protein UgpC [uncultured Desulfosarcina sp.]